jgi:hypothetical protein
LAAASARGCSQMGRNTVEIGKLHLRVPGLSRGEAQHLGNEVAHHIAQRLPSTGRREQFGAIDMRVRIHSGTLRDQLARLIAQAILEELR